jgi:hypothetical protein
MDRKILFVINDYFGHGGHVKSFIAQIQTIEYLFKDIKIICSDTGYIVKNLDKFENIKKENLLFAELSKLRRLQFSFKLMNIIKSNLSDNSILHVYSPECYFSALFAQSYFKNILFINSVMGGPNPFPYFLSTDLYIAVSEEQKSSALENIKNYDKKRINIIKNRVILSKDDKNLILEEKAILIVTRFDVDKLESLTRIFSIINLLSNKYSIIIAGSGELLDQYKIKYQAYDNILFIGYCNNLMKYQSQVAVVLGMGRSILEFMLCKTPGILIGFNGIEMLDRVETVKFASLYNFAGRKVLNDINNSETVKKIEYIIDKNMRIDESVYLFLKQEYDVDFFQKKYLQLINSVNSQKIKKKQIYIEFISFFIVRVKRTIRRKFASNK